MDSPIYGFLATDHVLDVGEPLVDRRAHQPALRAGDRLRDGPRPVRRARHRDRGAGRHGRGRGRDRGARLALHRLPVHDARRGGGQRLGRAVRHRHAGPARRHRPATGRRGARAERRRRRHRVGCRLARPPGGRRRVAGPLARRLRRGAARRRRDPLRRPDRRRTRSPPATSWSPPSTGSARWSSRAGDPGPARRPRRPGALDGRRTRAGPTWSSTSATGWSSPTRSARTSRTRWSRGCSATAAWSAPATGTPSTSPPAPAATPAEVDLPLHPVVEEDGMLYAEVTVEPQLSWSERLRAHAAGHERGAT